MRNIGLHQQLSHYFRPSSFQSLLDCRQLYKTLDGYTQLLTVVYMSRNLEINLETYPTF